MRWILIAVAGLLFNCAPSVTYKSVADHSNVSRIAKVVLVVDGPDKKSVLLEKLPVYISEALAKNGVEPILYNNEMSLDTNPVQMFADSVHAENVLSFVITNTQYLKGCIGLANAESMLRDARQKKPFWKAQLECEVTFTAPGYETYFASQFALSLIECLKKDGFIANNTLTDTIK